MLTWPCRFLAFVVAAPHRTASVLHTLQPLMALVPEVKQADKKVTEAPLAIGWRGITR